MNCTELKADRHRVAAERATEVEWLTVCHHREAEARRAAEIAEEQIFALDLQLDRLERALADCLTYGGRR